MVNLIERWLSRALKSEPNQAKICLQAKDRTEKFNTDRFQLVLSDIMNLELRKTFFLLDYNSPVPNVSSCTAFCLGDQYLK